ncbi:hypothetical protein J8273_4716 [Carpediemonas membranifera]|uniref:Uncharacterized protein n=1 Tax=Carpediemonas membranifera TaxID=201153 RepID=A0A8J6ATN8_9EUKA|nr:hypothetical protein J8273_4716 [Carpediemonas membranifera]|eukprot:KAG9393853.1 hypothetical protein J8273_4716 [Carpediemonas membranifera]
MSADCLGQFSAGADGFIAGQSLNFLKKIAAMAGFSSRYLPQSLSRWDIHRLKFDIAVTLAEGNCRVYNASKGATDPSF